MTLYTQVHLDNGPKSTNTICGEKHKTYKMGSRKKASDAQREKSREARRELVALTKHLKAIQKTQAAAAGSESERAAMLGKTPNDLLRDHYLGVTGATELRTFGQWKDAGFYVKKGETALRVLGKPFKASSEQVVVTAEGAQTVVNNYDRFPMVPLYSNLQVEVVQSDECADTDTDTDTDTELEYTGLDSGLRSSAVNMERSNVIAVPFRPAE